MNTPLSHEHSTKIQTTASALKVTNLVKAYGSLRAVNDVSFEVHSGEVFGLLGPNGAGKTSLISCLVTLEVPTAGRCEIFGRDVSKDPKSTKLMTGFVPQELINHGYFNIEEIMEFHSGYFGRPNNKEHIHYLLHRLGLFEHRFKKVKALSGGMKRRLLIAKALVHKPRLLLLDEPTAGVDVDLRMKLWEFVQELKKEGLSILLTTHYLEEAEQLCDRVGFLQRGVLKKVGPTKQLVKDLTSRQIVVTLKEPLGDFSHPLLNWSQGAQLSFSAPSSTTVGDLLSDMKLDLKSIVDLQIQEGRLEDAFKTILSEPHT